MQRVRLPEAEAHEGRMEMEDAEQAEAPLHQAQAHQGEDHKDGQDGKAQALILIHFGCVFKVLVESS